MIKCRVCHETLPETSFYKAAKKNYRDKICKSCKHVKMQRRRYDLKTWMIEYKGGSCMVCGYNKCQSALQFHHIDPTQKDFDLSDRGLVSKDRAAKELDKCVLLCANCHAEVHAGVTYLSI